MAAARKTGWHQGRDSGEHQSSSGRIGRRTGFRPAKSYGLSVVGYGNTPATPGSDLPASGVTRGGRRYRGVQHRRARGRTRCDAGHADARLESKGCGRARRAVRRFDGADSGRGSRSVLRHQLSHRHPVAIEQPGARQDDRSAAPDGADSRTFAISCVARDAMHFFAWACTTAQAKSGSIEPDALKRALESVGSVGAGAAFRLSWGIELLDLRPHHGGRGLQQVLGTGPGQQAC